MAKKLYEEEDIRGIAEAIRTKNKTQNKYRVDQMEQAVLDIETSKPQQSKTVSPSTSQQTVTADEGYELASVQVNAMPDGTINLGIDANTGIIDASVSAAGYVDTGDNKKLYLTTEAAKTVTPSTTSQVAVAASRWTTGPIRVAGDANLKSENIKSGKSIFGVNGSAPTVTVDGVTPTHNLNLTEDWADGNESMGSLPAQFTYGNATTWTDGIHLFGGANQSSSNLHYVWNGSTWTQLTNLPFAWPGGSVVFNNEIHVFAGGNNTAGHYKWNGSTWTKASTLPHGYFLDPVIYNNEIHAVGCASTDAYYKHYKFNGSTWTSVSSLGITFTTNLCAVYNNEIHISNQNFHQKWDGTKWSEASTLTGRARNIAGGHACVIKNKLHFIGSSYHAVWDGSVWRDRQDLPFTSAKEGGFAIKDDKAYLLSSGNSSNAYGFYRIMEKAYKEV